MPAEAAFRTAKSELGLSPIYHQLEARVPAHILVGFPARGLWRTLEQGMLAKGVGTCACQLPKNLGGIKSMDMLLPVKRGELTSELRRRVVATPEPATAQVLAHLGLRLPKGPREIAKGVPKPGG